MKHQEIMEMLEKEAVLDTVVWDLKKARYLLAELGDYFQCRDLDNPSPSTMACIQAGFENIAVKLSLADDVMASIEEKLAPIAEEYERGNH